MQQQALSTQAGRYGPAAASRSSKHFQHRQADISNHVQSSNRRELLRLVVVSPCTVVVDSAITGWASARSFGQLLHTHAMRLPLKERQLGVLQHLSGP